MRILHLPGAGLILGVSWTVVSLIYLVWFFKKEGKGVLDFLKLLWILGTATSMLISLPMILAILIEVLLWSLLAVYWYRFYFRSKGLVT